MLSFTQWVEQLNELSDKTKDSAFKLAADRAARLNDVVHHSLEKAKSLPLSLYHNYRKTAVEPVKNKVQKHAEFMHRVIKNQTQKPAEKKEEPEHESA